MLKEKHLNWTFSDKKTKFAIASMIIIMFFMIQLFFYFFYKNEVGIKLDVNSSREVVINEELIEGMDNPVIFFTHPNFYNIELFYVKSNMKAEGVRLECIREALPYHRIDIDKLKNSVLVVEIDSIVENYEVILSEFHDYVHYNNSLLGGLMFSLGIMFAMLLANFILALFMNEKYFFLHGVYLLSAFMYQFFTTGVSRAVSGIHYDHYLKLAFVAYISMLLFVKYYLKVFKLVKNAAVIYNALIVISLIYIVFPFSHGSLYYGAAVIGVINTILVLYSIMRIGKYHYSITPYFKIGAFLIGVAIVMMILEQEGFFSNNIVMKYAFSYALAVESIFFTLGIMDQISDDAKKMNLYYENATKDNLTGAYNRHYLEGNLSSWIKSSNNDGEKLSFIIMDIDHFKNINDTYGHDIGDEVLKELCELISSNVRKSDYLIRWGGEEFILVLRNTNLILAQEKAENLVKTVASSKLSIIEKVTISAGVAELHDDEIFEALYRRMDQALYSAKSNGRNCVVTSFEKLSLKDMEIIIPEWKSEYDSGVDKIDGQHRALLEMLSVLNTQMYSDDLSSFCRGVETLIKELELHFMSEEEILYDVNYVNLKEHKSIHRQLIVDANAVLRALYNKEIDRKWALLSLMNSVVMGHSLCVKLIVRRPKKIYSSMKD